jgi:pimeloyl-ACP methyl ester carboxylesterase
LVLVAPAADMTSALLWPEMTEADRATLVRTGVWHRPSDYGAPYPVTLSLIEDGVGHALLDKVLSLPFPVRILQGTEDVDVPPAHAFRTMNALTGDVTLTLVKGGDHRLSTTPHLRILQETVLQLARRSDGESV